MQVQQWRPSARDREQRVPIWSHHSKFTRFTILAALRSGAPWRDLPETYGARTTCYNRFVRWRQAGIWDRIMDALAAGHDAAADDRYLRRVGAPARCLHHGQ
jgi:transposase